MLPKKQRTGVHMYIQSIFLQKNEVCRHVYYTFNWIRSDQIGIQIAYTLGFGRSVSHSMNGRGGVEVPGGCSSPANWRKARRWGPGHLAYGGGGGPPAHSRRHQRVDTQRTRGARDTRARMRGERPNGRTKGRSAARKAKAEGPGRRCTTL